MGPGEKRVAERVHVALPLYIGQQESVTRDVSRSGLYFFSEWCFSRGKTLNFVLSFDYILNGEAVKLSCLGEVVRVEPHNKKFGIAAKIKDLKFTH